MVVKSECGKQLIFSSLTHVYLVIAFNWLGQGLVDNKSDVGLVNAHPKGDGGAHHSYPVLGEAYEMHVWQAIKKGNLYLWVGFVLHKRVHWHVPRSTGPGSGCGQGVSGRHGRGQPAGGHNTLKTKLQSVKIRLYSNMQPRQTVKTW